MRAELSVSKDQLIKAIADYSASLELLPVGTVFTKRGLAKKGLKDLKGACEYWKKAAALGDVDAAVLLEQHC